MRDLRPPARSTRSHPHNDATAANHAAAHESAHKAAGTRQHDKASRAHDAAHTNTAAVASAISPTSDKGRTDDNGRTSRAVHRNDNQPTTPPYAPERRIARRTATSNNSQPETSPAATTPQPVSIEPTAAAQLAAALIERLRAAIGEEPVSRYFSDGNAFTFADDGSLNVHLSSDFQARRAKRYDTDLRTAVTELLRAGNTNPDNQHAADASPNVLYHVNPSITTSATHTTKQSLNHAQHTAAISNVEPKPSIAEKQTNSPASNGHISPIPQHRPQTQPRSRRLNAQGGSKDASDQLIADDRYALERFITGPSNQIAYRAAVYVASGLGAAAEQPTDNNHTNNGSNGNNNNLNHRHIRNPAFVAPERIGHLFLHGCCGTGKTHLLLGIARRYKQCNPTAAVRYITGPAFADAYINAVRTRTVPAFRRAYRNLGLLCIDDVHFLADKDGTQTELLHTFDELDLGGATVVLASDDHPKRIERFRSALVSRFVSGLVLEVHRPDRDLFKRILDESCRRTGLRLEASAAARLLDELDPGTSSVRDLEGLVLKVNAMTTVLGLRDDVVGLSIVEQAIRGGRTDHARPGAAARKPIRLDALVTEICAYLSVEIDDLKGSGRHKRVVLARSMAAFLGRTMTSASFPELARAMNRKSHSAVIAARDRFQEQLERDAPAPTFDDHIQQLGARTLKDLVALTKSHVERHAR